jgi:outer membrane protein insertion porin family
VITLSQPRRLWKQVLSKSLTKAAFLSLILISLFALRAGAQQPSPSPTVRLDRIEVTGLERLTAAEVVAESGLQLGQTVDPEVLDAAANRLLATGLFKNLSYRFSAKTGQGIVTFVVEEMKSRVPIVFDNFVWFTNEELVGAVRRAVPAFDGTAPEAGTVTDTIRKALTELLRERKIAGEVVYTPSASPVGRNPEHVFSVRGADLRVCTLKFPGAAAVQEKELVQNSSGIFNNEYSRAYVLDYALSNLFPLYRERGHLRATFGAPEVKLENSPECERGVALALPVDEGAAYVWSKAEWEGNEALTAAELDAALGMRVRELANGLKIDKGVDALRRAYARRGYLAARLSAAPEFDDANRRVLYRFQAVEGPQYRMGELTIRGLSEKDTNNLRTRWRLLPREAYDAGYLDEFLKTGFREFQKDLLTTDGKNLGPIKIESAAQPDREKLTVDVTIEIKPDVKP